jgi:hypothetical protein
MRQLSQFSRNILTCHACPHRQASCRGPCACLKDNRDIIEHARAHDCPAEKFRARGLGDTVAWILQRLGVAYLHRRFRARAAPAHAAGKSGCGCLQRREKLNDMIAYR